jgi:phospholipase/carboxylesterase
LPIHYAREAKAYLEKIEVPLTYHEYPVGHQINAHIINDLVNWLQEGEATKK